MYVCVCVYNFQLPCFMRAAALLRAEIALMVARAVQNMFNEHIHMLHYDYINICVRSDYEICIAYIRNTRGQYNLIWAKQPYRIPAPQPPPPPQTYP